MKTKKLDKSSHKGTNVWANKKLIDGLQINTNKRYVRISYSTLNGELDPTSGKLEYSDNADFSDHRKIGFIKYIMDLLKLLIFWR